MRKKSNYLKKLYQSFLTLALVLTSILGPVQPVLAVNAEEVASVITEWNVTGTNSFNAATSLNVATGGRTFPVTATTGTGEITSNGSGELVWGSGGITQNRDWGAGVYWQFATSTKGATNLTFSAALRSSATGPGQFILSYSLDGATWTEIENSTVRPTTTAITQTANLTIDELVLPVALWNQEQVFLRLTVNSEGSVNYFTGGGGAQLIQPAGTSTINRVAIRGIETVVEPVVATPDSGEIALGSAIELSTPTVGAMIFYSTDGITFNAYEAPIIASELPLTIRSFAVLRGIESEMRTFTFSEQEIANNYEEVVLAEWIFPDNPSFNAAVTEDGILASRGSGLLSSNNPRNIIRQANGITIQGGWLENVYWQLAFPTTDTSELTLSADMRSTATGPGEFTLEYSVDGVTWIEVDESAVRPNTTLRSVFNNFELPSALENQAQVYLRFVAGPYTERGLRDNTGERLADIYTPTSLHTSNIHNIVISGMQAVAGPITPVEPVRAYPETRTIPLGTEITLATATAGAAIFYSTDGENFNLYEEAIIASELPLTIHAYAELNGVRSEVSIFQFIERREISRPITPEMIPDGVLTIAEFYDLPDAAMGVRVIGQLTYSFASSGAGAHNHFYIQDVIDGEVYGLQIFSSAAAIRNLQIGDIVVLTGNVASHNGVRQMSGITQAGHVERLDYEVAPFPPMELTIAEIHARGDRQLSIYTVVREATLISLSGNNLRIGDETGEINIFTPPSLPEGVTMGSIVDVYALATRNFNTRQLRMSGSDRFAIPNAPEVNHGITIPAAQLAGSAVPTEAVVFGDWLAPNDGQRTNVTLELSNGMIPATATGLGFVNMQAGDFYEVAFNTLGLANNRVTFQVSGDEAQSLRIEYSVDGVNFRAINNQIYANNSSVSALLPLSANHQAEVTLRIIAEGIGTNELRNFAVNGHPVISDTIAEFPLVTPAGGMTLVGDQLTMTTMTDATIWYSLDTDFGNFEFRSYDPANRPHLTELPAAVTVFASNENMDDSAIHTFSFTQKQVEAVRVSPNGGAVNIGTRVRLSTPTPDAAIFYSTDEGVTWNEYDPETRLQLNELPVDLQIKAVKLGYLDSDIVTVSFTERIENFQLFFGQLHAHTTLSDGAGEVEEAFAWARDIAGNDFFAVTDHSNWFDNNRSGNLHDGSNSQMWRRGQRAAYEATTDYFVGLMGFEMTWANGIGHINTFNTDGFISREQPEFNHRQLGLQRYYEALKEVPDSISQFNHPGRSFGDFDDFAHFDPEIAELITLIEVGSGELAVGSSGYFRSHEYFTRALDRGWFLGPTANQDNHQGNFGNSNSIRTVILADELTEESVLDALRNRRVYATETEDFELHFSLDGHIKGTILEPDDVDGTVELVVEMNSPNMEIGTVKVIVDGGLVLDYTFIDETAGTAIFNLPSDYSYYYIKIIQPNGHITVSAPVWVGTVEAAGISRFTTNTPLQVTGEPIEVELELFNNVENDLTIVAATFMIANEVIHTVDLNEAGLTTLAAYTRQSYIFDYIHNTPGPVNMTVAVEARFGDTIRIYRDVLALDFIVPEMVTNITIDGTHYNDYVTGYYGDRMNNIALVAASLNARVTIVDDVMTPEILANTDLLIVSAPARRDDNAHADWGPYSPTHFSEEFIEMVADYVANGGTIITAALSDFQDRPVGQSSVEINRILSAIGATTRVNSDQLTDNDNNRNDQNFRLRFNRFDETSPFTANLQPGQEYSAFSAASVLIDPVAEAEGRATALVRGHATTFVQNRRQEGTSIFVPVPMGEAIALIHEELPSGANVFVSGAVFMSDFEIRAEVDSIWDLPLANRTIMENIIRSVRVQVPTSTIREARAGEYGDVFAVEGWVTAGTAIQGNTFFDAIYIQDATAGINIFPFAEAGVELGTKIRIVGYRCSYQGATQLVILEHEILEAEHLQVIEPTLLSLRDAMNYDLSGGLLAQIEGRVTAIDLILGTVSRIWLEDEAGNVGNVFIDGYIFSATTGRNELADYIEVGDTISAVGLIYRHPHGMGTEPITTMRVRNVDEVVRQHRPENLTISRLMIDGFEGIIDQEAATITFQIHNHFLTDGRYQGTITELVAADETIYFQVAGEEWPSRLGDLVGFATGDLVYVANGRIYTLIIEAPQEVGLINHLRIGSVTGIINQEEAIITFTIPRHLMINGQFRGPISQLIADCDTLIFFVAGSEWPVSLDQMTGVSDGDLVYVAGGRIYTIRIIIR